MKFAFRIGDRQASIAELGSVAKAFGFHGVEWDVPAEPPAFVDRGDVSVACLSSEPHHSDGRFDDHERAHHVRSLIDLAGRVSCSLVKVTEPAIRPGRNRSEAGILLGDWFLPLADYAADRGVVLALHNARSLRSAREVWAILDRLNHPAMGCCLDVMTAALIGESPQVAVPMLNSRIVYVQVGDAGQVASEIGLIRTTLRRLRGIGYSGWISVSSAAPREANGEDLSNLIRTLGELAPGRDGVPA